MAVTEACRRCGAFYFILFCSEGGREGWGKRKNVINLLGGGNSITSSYSAMQSVVRGDVTGCQAESQGCLHFKPNFQFSPPIFLHSHWSWKLSTAHLCGEGGRGIKGKLHFRSLTSYLFNLHYLYVGMGKAVELFILFGALRNVYTRLNWIFRSRKSVKK